MDHSHDSPNGSPASGGSAQDLMGDINLSVDIGRNHNVGCAPVFGRESHTADMDVFDRYVDLLRAEREQMIEIDEHRQHQATSDESTPRSDNDDASRTTTSTCNACVPFNSDFWSYVRSILSTAKPVGFTELDDPRGVVPKGPDEADAFLQKAIGIGPINPIVPANLAQSGGFAEETVLSELLYATRVGMVRIQFAPECDRCGSVVTARDRLGDIPPWASCGGCHQPNHIHSMDRIKVLFVLNPDILYVLADNFACTPSAESMEKTVIFAAVPATATGSGFRYSVGIGGEKELRPALDPGRYRMHCPVARTDNFLVVQRKATEEDEPYRLDLRVSNVVCDAQTCSPLPRPERGDTDDTDGATDAEYRSRLKTLTVPHGKIHFDVLPDTNSFFVLWVQEDADDDVLMRLPEEERESYTKASSVIHNPVFNEFFADQVVSSQPDALLSIQNVVLVFTDVVGSTDLYAFMGDGPALQLIRKHFKILFGAFTKRGRVVKTMGDAVMASFTSGRAAMNAVADALVVVAQECKLPDGTPLQIRIGIHSGPAIVVPVNGVNDFFGQTVNIAARVQSAAKACECFVTEDLLASDPDSRNAYYELLGGNYARRRSSGGEGPNDDLSLNGEGMKVFDSTPATELHLKGVNHVVRARGFRLHNRPRRDSDVDGTAPPTRTYRRSGMFERRRLSGVSIDSSDTNGTPAMQRRASRRASMLGEVEEENANRNTYEAGSDCSPLDREFSIDLAEQEARMK